MTRPRVLPLVFSTLTAQAPSRVVKRLDSNPTLALTWAWAADGLTVTTEGGETVTLAPLDGVVRAVEGLTCSCLLGPRCLHVLAVASVLEVEPATEADATPPVTPATTPRADELPVVELTGAQRLVALEAFAAGAELLASGAARAGAVVRGELLRSIHGCRVEGLHRLAVCGLRLVQALKELREERPEFERRAFTDDLAEWLWVSSALCDARRPLGASALLGVARRSYAPVGHLQLTGLFSEPVVARSGYAGVVTTLTDGHGRCLTVNEVQPGDASRVPSAYRAGAKLGGGAITHQALGRSALLVEKATRSADGRLGAGAGVLAVLAGPASWADAAVQALFEAPIDSQLDRLFGPAGQPRRAETGDSPLLFFTAEVRGRLGSALALEERARKVTWLGLAPSPLAELCYVENLELLARLPGLVARFIGRPVRGQARSVELLALSVAGLVAPENATAPRLELPDDWRGLVNLGLDRLQRSLATGATARPVELEAVEPGAGSPLEPLRRRLEQLAVAGPLSLSPALVEQVAREAQRLETQLMPEAARALSALAQAAQPHPHQPFEPQRLGQAFARAALYLLEASRSLDRAAWSP